VAYKSKKDKVFRVWEIDIGNGKHVIVSLRSYAGAEPRLIIDHQVIEKPDGVIVHAKIRHWYFESLLDLQKIITEALELMDELAAERGTA